MKGVRSLLTRHLVLKVFKLFLPSLDNIIDLELIHDFRETESLNLSPQNTIRLYIE